MKDNVAIWIFCLVALVITAMFLQCSPIGEGGKLPELIIPGGGTPTGPCSVTNKDLKAIPFYASCGDPTGQGIQISVTQVQGTANTIQQGSLFEILGQYSFPQGTKGNLEPVIGCPPGSPYPKCSFGINQTSGAFTVWTKADQCDLIYPETQLYIYFNNLNDNTLNQLCVVYLGGTGPSGDDDTSVDDDSGLGDDSGL